MFFQTSFPIRLDIYYIYPLAYREKKNAISSRGYLPPYPFFISYLQFGYTFTHL